jgi:hypothetical protein
MTKSQRGFSSIHLLCFLPVLLAIAYALYFFFIFSTSHQYMTQTCLKEQIKIQEDVKTALRSLFKLNPKAQKLRLQYQAAKGRYLAAQASMNAAATAAAFAQMTYILSQRRLLDLHQRNIIKSINFHIQISQIKLQMNLERSGRERTANFFSFADFKIRNLRFKKVELAVKPNIPDWAPTYSTSENFLNDQALEFSWHLLLSGRGPAKMFLPVSTSFPHTCSTTINTAEDKWPTVTRRVKLSLKQSS